MDSGIPAQWQGDISYQATATAIVCLIFSVGILAIRAFSKFVTKTRVGLDDWLLIPAGFFQIALCAVELYDPPNDGLGQHETAVWLEGAQKLVIYAQSQVVFINFYICCVTFPKLVLLVLYLRIFRDRSARTAVYILMSVVVTYFLIAIFVSNLMCVPISALWDTTLTTAKCINLPAWFAYSTIPNIVTDLAVLVLPIPSLLALKLPLRDRVGLILTFSCGGIGTLGCIARTIVNAYINGSTDDVTWTGVPLGIVALVEVTLYLLAATLPGLRPLYLHVRGKGQFSGRKQSYNDGDTTLGTDESSTSKSRKLVSIYSPYSIKSHDSLQSPRSVPMEYKEGAGRPTQSPLSFPRPTIQITHSYEVHRQGNGLSSLGTGAPPRPT